MSTQTHKDVLDRIIAQAEICAMNPDYFYSTHFREGKRDVKFVIVSPERFEATEAALLRLAEYAERLDKIQADCTRAGNHQWLLPGNTCPKCYGVIKSI